MDPFLVLIDLCQNPQEEIKYVLLPSSPSPALGGRAQGVPILCLCESSEVLVVAYIWQTAKSHAIYAKFVNSAT